MMVKAASATIVVTALTIKTILTRNRVVGIIHGTIDFFECVAQRGKSTVDAFFIGWKCHENKVSHQG